MTNNNNDLEMVDETFGQPPLQLSMSKSTSFYFILLISNF